MSSRAFHTITAFFLFAVLMLAAVLYWPGLGGPFLLDDTQNIVRAYVPDFDKDALIYAATHNTSGVLKRPVSVLSLVFSGIVHGPGSWGYKYHNLLIHLINGLLIFWLLLKLLPRMAGHLSREKAVLIAGVSASIWLLHPLMVSTVLYAVQRMAQLSTLFTLISLLCYVFARLNLSGSRTRFIALAYIGFPLSMLLAVFSKENGALLPLYVLAIEIIVFGFKAETRGEKIRLGVFLGAFVALPILLGTVYALTHLDSLADYTLRDFDAGERLMTQLYVVVFYLKLILLPRLSDMGLYHDDIEVIRQFDLLTLCLLLLLASSVVLVFYLRKKAPVVSFAIAWFLVSHLMESTFLNLELVFEHRNYLAAAGPLLALVYYLFEASKYPWLKHLTLLFFALVVFLTANRVQVWKSMPVLYQMAVIDHPRSYRANTEFANYSFNAGDRALALEHLDLAQELNQKELGAVLHEIVYRCGQGEDLAPQFEEARKRASTYPVSAYAMNGFDSLLGLHQKGLCPEVSLEQILDLVLAAKGQEDISSNREYLGYLERAEGQIYILQNRYVEGVRHITRAYEYTGQILILTELARIQLTLGRLHDVRQLIDFLEKLNGERFGTETAKIQPLKEFLVKLEAEQENERESKAGAGNE